MEYTISFTDGKEIAKFASFEFALISAKAFSKMLINKTIVLRSTFFTYIYINGVEI